MLQNTPDEDRIVKLSDGTEVYIRNPTRQIREQAESEGTKAYFRAIENGCKMRNQMVLWLQEQGIWNSTSDEEIARLQQELYLLREKIDAGGIRKSEAKNYAIRCIQISNMINQELTDRISYLTETVESKKRNAEFNYIIYACSVYNTDRRKQFYPTYDDYLNSKESADSDRIANKCTELFYGVPDSDDTPERAFLKEHKFVDEEMHLINEDGHRTDFDGRLVDENGNYIKYVGEGTDKKAVLVDIDGNEVQPFERKPFLDDDDTPITDGAPVESLAEPKPKKTRKKAVKKVVEKTE